ESGVAFHTARSRRIVMRKAVRSGPRARQTPGSRRRRRDSPLEGPAQELHTSIQYSDSKSSLLETVRSMLSRTGIRTAGVLSEKRARVERGRPVTLMSLTQRGWPAGHNRSPGFKFQSKGKQF